MWRLRSLIAMGHDCTRIARALDVRPSTMRRVVSGQARTVTSAFRAPACQLWDAWWDKTPPQRTPAERRAAARALRQAEASNWPAAAGLDEDQLDDPGYRPWCRYRPATGTGTAPDFPPARPRPQHQGDRVTPPTTHAAHDGSRADESATPHDQPLAASPQAALVSPTGPHRPAQLSDRVHAAADDHARAQAGPSPKPRPARHARPHLPRPQVHLAAQPSGRGGQRRQRRHH